MTDRETSLVAKVDMPLIPWRIELNEPCIDRSGSRATREHNEKLPSRSYRSRSFTHNTVGHGLDQLIKIRVHMPT